MAYTSALQQSLGDVRPEELSAAGTGVISESANLAKEAGRRSDELGQKMREQVRRQREQKNFRRMLELAAGTGLSFVPGIGPIVGPAVGGFLSGGDPAVGAGLDLFSTLQKQRQV